MEVTVRTVFRPLTLTGVEAEVDVSTVKAMLYELGQREQVPVPVPSKQRLVYKGTVLNTGTLKQAGFVSGEQLVLILPSRSACVKVTPVDTTPVPNRATIRAAILEEARRRGMDVSRLEEGHPHGVRPFTLPAEMMAMEMDQSLLNLLTALGGGRPTVLGGRHEGAGGGAGGANQEQQQGHRRFLQPLVFGQPAQPPPPAQPPAPPPPAAIPEPDPEAAQQLAEMGFGEAVVRKALLLHRNGLEAALNWLLQHGEDPAAAEPLTEEQLQQIYARGPRGPPSEVEQVEQLVAMGFGRPEATAALRRMRNMDLALAYLLRQREEQEQQQQQQGGQGQGVGAGQEVQGQGGEVGRAGGEGRQQGSRERGAGEAEATEGSGQAVGAGGREEGRADGGQREGEEDEEVDEEDEEEDEEDEEDEDEDIDDDDDFTGDGEDVPSMIEQLAGAARGEEPTTIRIPLGGGLAAALGAAMPDEAVFGGGGGGGGGFGGFGAAPQLVGGPQASVAVTRGPDGTDLVLGSGTTMPPLMPARGIMLGGGVGAGGGGGMGAVAAMPDLPGLAMADEDAEEEALRSLGLLQQLLNGVMQDLMGAGPGGGGAPGQGAGGRGQGGR